MTVLAWAKVVMAVLGRPSLWVTALRQLRRLAPRHWWASWPPLPVPRRDYRAMRMVTQYGQPDHPPEPRDVLHYLMWCRQWEAGAS